MQTQLFLSRHGETQWNLVKRLQGRLNSEMTEKGLEQARTLANTLTEEGIDLIVSSPLGRARITAEVCQSHINQPLVFHEGLIERHFGDWQGMLFEELSDQPKFSEIFFEVTEDAPPNGESGLDACLRLEQTLGKIAQQHPGQNVLVITHGDVLRCFFARLRARQFCDAYSQYGNSKYFKVSYCHQSKTFSALIG